MLQKKPGWKKPKLLVLTRVTEGEYVLDHCKFVAATSISAGPSSLADQGCSAETTSSCTNCHDRGGKGTS